MRCSGSVTVPAFYECVQRCNLRDPPWQIAPLPPTESEAIRPLALVDPGYEYEVYTQSLQSWTYINNNIQFGLLAVEIQLDPEHIIN